MIVFEAAMWGENSPRFKETFGAELKKLYWLNYRLLNTAQLVDYGDYFFLDEHITAAGHRKFAEALAREMTQWESIDPIIKNR